MIWAALNSKLDERGPLRFLGDVFELAVASGVIASGMVAGAVVVLPLLVLEYAMDARKACDAACAGDRKPCTHGEERR